MQGSKVFVVIHEVGDEGTDVHLFTTRRKALKKVESILTDYLAEQSKLDDEDHLEVQELLNENKVDEAWTARQTAMHNTLDPADMQSLYIEEKEIR